MAGEATMDALPALSPASRIVDAVQGALREAIIAGTLRAGEQLSVPELARRLNVSRSPVREAVLGLVAQGLAVEQPRRGVVVATIAAEDLVAIHEMREFLEAGAARLCARRIDKAGAERLRRILAEQKRAVKDCDAAGYFRTNAELHRAIAVGSGNQRLEQVLLVLANQMRIALHRVAEDVAHMQAGYDEHAAVVEAITAGEGDAAEQAMRRHIANTIERSRRAFAASR
jgi:DNA-binding GntR family transcriptional regulator